MNSVNEWLEVFEQDDGDYLRTPHVLRRYYNFKEDKRQRPRRVHYPEYDNVHEDYLPQPKKRAQNRHKRSKQL